MNSYHLIISTPDGNVFDGDTVSLVVRGTEGELAILAGHIPFITAVKEGVCRIELPDETDKTAAIGGGILTVSNKQTTLLCSKFEWK